MIQALSKNFIRLEEWIIILANTYSEHPSSSLAKIIHYYLNRLIKHDDFPLCSYYRCDYLTMQKYWQWLSMR